MQTLTTSVQNSLIAVSLTKKKNPHVFTLHFSMYVYILLFKTAKFTSTTQHNYQTHKTRPNGQVARYVWPPAHSGRFPCILVCHGPIKIVYLIWGGFDMITDGGVTGPCLKSHTRHVSLLWLVVRLSSCVKSTSPPCNLQGSQESDQTNQIWIKILRLHSLFPTLSVSEKLFSALTV